MALITAELKLGGALAPADGEKALRVFEFNRTTAPTKRHKVRRPAAVEVAAVGVVVLAAAAVVTRCNLSGLSTGSHHYQTAAGAKQQPLTSHDA